MRSRAIAYKASITNQCQGGGNKKAGLVPTATGQMLSIPFAWRKALGGIATPGNGRANGGNKVFVISTVNQLSGIGNMRSMIALSADGVQKNSIIAEAKKCGKSVRLNWPPKTMKNWSVAGKLYP